MNFSRFFKLYLVFCKNILEFLYFLKFKNLFNLARAEIFFPDSFLSSLWPGPPFLFLPTPAHSSFPPWANSSCGPSSPLCLSFLSLAATRPHTQRLLPPHTALAVLHYRASKLSFSSAGSCTLESIEDPVTSTLTLHVLLP